MKRWNCSGKEAYTPYSSGKNEFFEDDELINKKHLLIHMSIKVIRKPEAVARKISDSYHVINFLTREASENVSLAIGQADNHSETTKNVRSDRIYYVIEGKLMVKQGEKEFVAEPGDVVFIPRNTEYGFGGSFRAILINSPAFNPKDEVSHL